MQFINRIDDRSDVDFVCTEGQVNEFFFGDDLGYKPDLSDEEFMWSNTTKAVPMTDEEVADLFND